MPFKVVLHTKFLPKQLKKNKQQKVELKKLVEDIAEDPNIGTPLKGKESLFLKFKFGSKPEYRIIYTVYECREKTSNSCIQPLIGKSCGESNLECEGCVFFVMCRTREDLGKNYDGAKEILHRYLENINREKKD